MNQRRKVMQTVNLHPNDIFFKIIFFIHCLMKTPDEDNIIFKTAADFINNTNYPVFLTGKAGTGKTTFLKYIRESTTKNTVTVAPTGVAAINAGGTTIHSFFQLPFGPYLPVNKKHFSGQEVSDKHNLIGKLKLSSERKEMMQQLELLIIDEISMVRCDVLDAMDAVLRHVRNRHSALFGGVQVLYIGDMYQLPPVIKEDEWQILSSCYNNQYFFSSKAIAEQRPVYIELKKVYRQSDPVFIDLLNQVRNNELDQNGYELLHSRYMPGFKYDTTDNFITLTTHNNKADLINVEALSRLPAKGFSFKANIEGVFNENSYPADEMLNLKTGAQVMFIKNDTEKIRRYYNGKIGIVHKIEDDKIWIECNPGLIEVKKETWQNIQYSLNNKTQQIEEKELGSFTQYPLRLAWAITIHKSQGLTFEKAIIDAGKAFAPGQVYVALSRCTSLEGIVLHSRITYNSLQSDERIVEFSTKEQQEKVQEQILFTAGKQYQQEIIFQLFDFKNIAILLKGLLEWVKQNDSFGAAVLPWLHSLKMQVDVSIQHSEKFSRELDQFFSENLEPEKNDLLQQRFKKAASWFFTESLKTKEFLLQSPAVSDNRQLAKDYNLQLQKIFDSISYQLHLLDGGRDGFRLASYRQQKASFKKDAFPFNAYSGKSAYISNDILYPELYQALKEKRNQISNEKNMPVYMVCSSRSLEELTQFLPQTLHELGKINGFGNIKLKQFGNDFINIIIDYCDQHNLQSNVFSMPDKKARKPRKKNLNVSEKQDSKKISFDLYKAGKEISEIAAERNFAISTIEGHLAFFIETGELNIDELVDQKKQEMIRERIRETDNQSLHTLKDQLPDASYRELKWVMASEKNKFNHKRVIFQNHPGSL